MREHLATVTPLDVRQTGWAERLRKALPETPLADIDITRLHVNNAGQRPDGNDDVEAGGDDGDGDHSATGGIPSVETQGLLGQR